jgi:prepilin-type N-terminal cleavage/methylation domain-containing protein
MGVYCKRENKIKGGFSLVEMIISTAVLLIIGGAVVQFFMFGLSSFMLNQRDQVDLIQDETNARTALLAVARDARRSIETTVTSSNDLIFKTHDGTVITYSLNATGDLQRTTNLAGVVSNYVTPRLNKFTPELLDFDATTGNTALRASDTFSVYNDTGRTVLRIEIETERWLAFEVTYSLRRVSEKI